MLRDAGKHSRERQQEVVVTEHMFPVPRHHLPVPQERRDIYKPSLQRDDSIGNTRASQAQHLMSVGRGKKKTKEQNKNKKSRTGKSAPQKRLPRAGGAFLKSQLDYVLPERGPLALARRGVGQQSTGANLIPVNKVEVSEYSALLPSRATKTNQSIITKDMN